MTFQKVGVLGAGAWGTALALAAVKAGRDVHIWTRDEHLAEALSRGEGNERYLAGFDLPPLTASHRMEDLAGCDALLAVVPAQSAREALSSVAKIFPGGVPVALCAKGIEKDSLMLMTQVLDKVFPAALPAVLSGPSFARDVALGLPTAVTLASEDPTLGKAWMDAMGRPEFRPYHSDDLIGAEAGGAVKNVLAIACGIVEGLGLGKFGPCGADLARFRRDDAVRRGARCPRRNPDRLVRAGRSGADLFLRSVAQYEFWQGAGRGREPGEHSQKPDCRYRGCGDRARGSRTRRTAWCADADLRVRSVHPHRRERGRCHRSPPQPPVPAGGDGLTPSAPTLKLRSGIQSRPTST